jgi:hypothetical protein
MLFIKWWRADRSIAYKILTRKPQSQTSPLKVSQFSAMKGWI